MFLKITGTSCSPEDWILSSPLHFCQEKKTLPFVLFKAGRH